MIPLFVMPFILLVVLATSACGDEHVFLIVALCRPPPYQELGRAGTAGNRFTRDDKEGTPAGGKNYPENDLVKPPRRNTRAFSPAGIFGGEAPPRLAAQKSRPHAP